MDGPQWRSHIRDYIRTLKQTPSFSLLEEWTEVIKKLSQDQRSSHESILYKMDLIRSQQIYDLDDEIYYTCQYILCGLRWHGEMAERQIITREEFSIFLQSMSDFRNWHQHNIQIKQNALEINNFLDQQSLQQIGQHQNAVILHNNPEETLKMSMFIAYIEYNPNEEIITYLNRLYYQVVVYSQLELLTELLQKLINQEYNHHLYDKIHALLIAYNVSNVTYTGSLIQTTSMCITMTLALANGSDSAIARRELQNFLQFVLEDREHHENEQFQDRENITDVSTDAEI